MQRAENCCNPVHYRRLRRRAENRPSSHCTALHRKFAAPFAALLAPPSPAENALPSFADSACGPRPRLLPIHLQTTCTGTSRHSSVSRVARRFCHSFGHGSKPALRMIRCSWVRRLLRLVPVSGDDPYRPRLGLLPNLFKVRPQLGEDGDNAARLAPCRSVLGLRLSFWIRSQSTSCHRSPRCSEGHRKPP